MGELQSAIDRMKGKVHQNAKQKASKDRRHFNRHGSLPLLDESSAASERPIRHPPRREHTVEGVLPPVSAPDMPPRLQSRASEPQIPTVLRPPRGEHATPPSSGPSRPAIQSVLESLRKPMDIDWEDIPSSTPTPPCRGHKKRPSVASGSSSSNYKRESEVSTSPSSAVSPLSIHHGLHSPSDSLEEDSSMTTGDATSASSVDQLLTNDSVDQDELLPEVRQMSPEVPTPSAAAMPPPQPPAPQRLSNPPQLPRPSQLPNPTPAPPPLSRPFAPPSQIRPGQSQSTRPRASQHPPPLGMRRIPGQSSALTNVKKPYKLSVSHKTKKPPVSAQLERAVEPSISSREYRHNARSLSPAVPDPPHLAARASTKARQSPVLEMSARRPEPNNDEADDKDANSSADLWACFDD